MIPPHTALFAVLVSLCSIVPSQRSQATEMEKAGPIADRGPQLIAIVWVLTGASSITVAMRLASRSIRSNFGWSDTFMILSLV